VNNGALQTNNVGQPAVVARRVREHGRRVRRRKPARHRAGRFTVVLSVVSALLGVGVLVAPAAFAGPEIHDSGPAGTATITLRPYGNDPNTLALTYNGGKLSAVSAIDPIPILVGSLESGETAGITWARWPIEVHAEGCLVRIRLAPTGPWRPYPDFRAVAATTQQLDGLEDQRIVVAADTAELLAHWARLPTRESTPSSGEPWEHTWTLEYWWPRAQWCDALEVSWAARALRMRLAIDLAALDTAADTFTYTEL
jgi:hypothetical protein